MIEDNKARGTMRIKMTGSPSFPLKNFWRGRATAKRSDGNNENDPVKKNTQGEISKIMDGVRPSTSEASGSVGSFEEPSDKLSPSR